MKIETKVEVFDKVNFEDYYGNKQITIRMIDEKNKKEYSWTTKSLKAKDIEEGKEYIIKASLGKERPPRDIDYPCFNISNCFFKELKE